MLCPQCPDQTLVMADRQGVEIDYCPRCRGVWLDRGELDKIIERSQQAMAMAAPPARPQPPAPHGHPPAPHGHPGAERDYDERSRHPGHHAGHDSDYRPEHHHGRDAQRRRRGGFFGEFFDFD